MTKQVTRLYEQFQPEHYDLKLVPDREAMVFKGTLTLKGKKVGRPSKRLTLHQKELTITKATVVKLGKTKQTVKVSRINNQNSYDEVRLHTDELIYPGTYSLTLEFEGKITRPMNGIYPCFFKKGGKDKKLIATQFESHYAREAFPCIDEPEAKATFDLTLTSPAGEAVVANTPIKTQVQEGDQLITSFETTPKMSAYLLAFVYGEMEYKEAKTKTGIVIRSYATPDNIGLVDHSLDVAVKALEFFEKYFDTAYPLPKLDLVALPDFTVGAMENWGVVTFRETAMLCDPKTSSIESKQIVALVVAHELSHQWFGNLVTMKWWDDLWLNESFANLMEYRAVDELYPEWHIWEMFVANETGAAKRRDSLPDVQSIQTEVNHPDELGSLFDPSIVYAKGGSVLFMLMRYIGEDYFRRGLKLYFDKHHYGNTTAADLWTALSTASNTDINGFMTGWLTRPGYPVISIDWQPGEEKVSLSQQRFLSNPSAKATNSEPWQVPLATTLNLETPILNKASIDTNVKPAGKEPLIFNHDGTSYFLPRYLNDNHLKQIVDSLKSGQVSNIDRLLLLDNYTMLQRGGQSQTIDLLKLLDGYTNETSESVWGSMAVAVAEVRKLIESDEDSENKLNEMVRELVADLVKKLGWEDKPTDSAQTLRLRGLVYAVAAGAKLQTVLDEGLKRVSDFSKPADLSPSTRTTIYFIGARYGADAVFNKLINLHNKIQNADEKDELAGSLTGAKDPKRIAKLIDLLKSDHVRRQDLIHWYVWLLRNRYARKQAWLWMVKNWDWIVEEFGSDKRFGDFARYSGNVFSKKEEEKWFKDFFDPKSSQTALTREVKLAEQEMSSRIAWRTRNEASIKKYLS